MSPQKWVKAAVSKTNCSLMPLLLHMRNDTPAALRPSPNRRMRGALVNTPTPLGRRRHPAARAGALPHGRLPLPPRCPRRHAQCPAPRRRARAPRSLCVSPPPRACALPPAHARCSLAALGFPEGTPAPSAVVSRIPRSAPLPSPAAAARPGPALAAGGGMVQTDGQAALDEPQGSPNAAGGPGAPLESAGAAAAAVGPGGDDTDTEAEAAGGARRFLCGVVEGEAPCWDPSPP